MLTLEQRQACGSALRVAGVALLAALVAIFLFSPNFLHLLDLSAFFLKFRFQSIGDLLDGVLFALCVKHKQRFVTVVHISWVLLKVFIAETSPLSIAHFTASTARSIVDLTTGFSSSKKRLNT